MREQGGEEHRGSAGKKSDGGRSDRDVETMVRAL